jgi:hypothetical protein
MASMTAGAARKFPDKFHRSWIAEEGPKGGERQGESCWAFGSALLSPLRRDEASGAEEEDRRSERCSKVPCEVRRHVDCRFQHSRTMGIVEGVDEIRAKHHQANRTAEGDLADLHCQRFTPALDTDPVLVRCLEQGSELVAVLANEGASGEAAKSLTSRDRA